MRRAARHLAALCAAISVASAVDADVAEALDQCLVDPSIAQAIFDQRYPHETCDMATSCDPRLVRSATILARQTCRTDAITSCLEQTQPEICHTELVTRWSAPAQAISEELKRRWSQIDRSKASKFAIIRFDKPRTLKLQSLDESCPQPSVAVTVAGHIECELLLAFGNISRMESAERFLAAEEARQ